MKKLIIACVFTLIGVILLSSVAKADGVIYWDGNGGGNLPCQYGGYWVLSPAPDVTNATLTVNGFDYPMWKTGNNWKGESVGYLDDKLTAYVTYTGETDAHLQLSHCTEGTPTPTDTEVPSATNTPTSTTATETSIPTSTETATSTSLNTQTETNVPTITPDPNTPTSTQIFTPTGTQHTPTIVPTNTPTIVPTNTPTNTPTETMTITNDPRTSTPFPPIPAVADSNINYSGKYIGDMTIGNILFPLYKGINEEDGSLMLPSFNRGAALYNNVIWVHREWKTGDVDLRVDSVVTVLNTRYIVTNVEYLPYGIYPRNNGFYIATCYKDSSGDWSGVALYKLMENAK